jgi:hypothetical protein
VKHGLSRDRHQSVFEDRPGFLVVGGAAMGFEEAGQTDGDLGEVPAEPIEVE